jgi:hypothetical protein
MGVPAPLVGALRWGGTRTTPTLLGAEGLRKTAVDVNEGRQRGGESQGWQSRDPSEDLTTEATERSDVLPPVTSVASVVNLPWGSRRTGW